MVEDTKQALVMTGMILLKVEKVKILMEDSWQALVMAGMLPFMVEEVKSWVEDSWQKQEFCKSLMRRKIKRYTRTG